jgi:hypothetical protein
MRLVALLVLLPAVAIAEDITLSTFPIGVKNAALIQPVTRYGHDALGAGHEYGAMRLRLDLCIVCGSIKEKDVVFTLPQTRVFEDVMARKVDLDGDGYTEAVMVVETDVSLGASLAIYGPEGKLAATDFIGQRHRWLAPVGVGNFDGQGGVEIAYVDRPHLTQELVVVRYADGVVTEVAREAGFTNHQFGAAVIAGGVRSCGGRDSMIVASGDWTRALDVVLRDGAFVVTDLGAIAGLGDLAAFMTCN